MPGSKPEHLFWAQASFNLPKFFELSVQPPLCLVQALFCRLLENFARFASNSCSGVGVALGAHFRLFSRHRSVQLQDLRHAEGLFSVQLKHGPIAPCNRVHRARQPSGISSRMRKFRKCRQNAIRHMRTKLVAQLLSVSLCFPEGW